MQPGRPLDFGGVAAAYERGRPGYPRALVDTVLEGFNDRPCDVLEVGAGTGKATRLIAERGHRVVAIEPSSELAAIARTAAAPGGDVTVVVGRFEDLEVPVSRFDLVVSAQAWHWIPREVRHVKARSALRPQGELAVFWTHPRWSTMRLTAELAAAYDRHAPELAADGPWFPGFTGPYGTERPAGTETEAYFEPMRERRFEWRCVYDSDMYVDLLRSFPEHHLLPARRRERLFAELHLAVVGAGGYLDLHLESRLYRATAR